MAGLGGFNMFGKIQEIQNRVKQMQAELEQKQYECASGGGMVKATVNGKGDLLKIKVDPTVVDRDDLEMLEDLIVAAVSAATLRSREEMKEQISKAAGGLNLPGMDQLGKMLGLG